MIADVYRAAEPDLSFLDLTTVAEAAGRTLNVRPVGLMLAGTDAVAFDTVAAHAIGYQDLPLWVSHYGHKFGLGCNSLKNINIRGIDWPRFERQRLEPPETTPGRPHPSAVVTAMINNLLLRPRPTVDPRMCTKCGDCASRCPVGAIKLGSGDGVAAIHLKQCSDCGICINACEADAISLEFTGPVRSVRRLVNHMKAITPAANKFLDPAPPK